MKDIEYRIETELKTPLLGSPYVQYILYKNYKDRGSDSYGLPNSPCGRLEKIIFKSKDKALVDKFIKQLENK